MPSRLLPDIPVWVLFLGGFPESEQAFKTDHRQTKAEEGEVDFLPPYDVLAVTQEAWCPPTPAGSFSHKHLFLKKLKRILLSLKGCVLFLVAVDFG